MRGLLWNCQKHGHRIDHDWPAETIVVKTPRGKFFAFAMGRCDSCGGFYSIKSEAPEPTGLVDTKGKVIA